MRVEVAMDLALRVDRHVARDRVRLRRTRQEVVDHQLVLARTRLRRVEEREAVVDAVRGRTERKQVFGVVGEAVVVGIVLGAILRDAPEVLPPVGDVVAVDVSGRGVGRIERAVRLQAAGEVDEVGLVGRHLDAEVVDRRIPVQRNLGIEVRAVVLAGILLPPVGKSVAGRVALRLLPGFGRRAVVPHLRTGLRVRTAERQQVGRADEAAADVVAVHVEDRLVGVAAQVEEPVQGEELDVAVNPVVGARIRHRVVREHELVDAVRHRRGVVSAELFGEEEVVNAAAVHHRQVRDRVLDPRHDARVAVDRAPQAAALPPADADAALELVGAGLAVLEPARIGEAVRVHVGVARREVVVLGLLRDRLLETARQLRDVGRVHRARHRHEVVVVQELGRQHRLARGVVARRALQPGLVDRRAVRLDVRKTHARAVVRQNLRTGARAVPDAHFVDIAVEVLAHVGERLDVLAVADEVRIERHHAVHGVLRVLRTRADVKRHRPTAVLVCREARGIRRILSDLRDAIRRNEGGRLLLAEIAVHVELQRLAVVGEGDVRPLGERQHETVDAHAAQRLVETRLDRVVVVEHAVDAAVRREADAEVRANGAARLRDRIATVVGGALDDRLVGTRLLRPDPRLDRELLQQVEGVDAAVLQVTRHHIRVLAREIHRLTAVRIAEVQRRGHGLHRLDDLAAVGLPVVVGIVAFVLLEGEEVGGIRLLHGDEVVVLARDADRVRVQPERQDGDRRIDSIVLRHVAVRLRRVSHPQRRRVGVARLRTRLIRDNALVVIAEAVAVGIGRPAADRPRIEHRVVCHRRGDRHLAVAGRDLGVERKITVVVRMSPLVPVGVVEDRHTIGLCNHVLAAGRFGIGAQERVEPVEEFVEVVHAVAVGVGLLRRRRDILAVHRRTHVSLPVDIHRVVVADDAVEAVGHRRHVAERLPALVRPRMAVPEVDRLARMRGEPLGVVHVLQDEVGLRPEQEVRRHRHREVRGDDMRVRVLRHHHRVRLRVDAEDVRVIPRGRRLEAEFVRALHHRREVEEVLLMVRPLLEDTAHERGRDVVVAEVADGLDEVFLPVLESVMVPVDVAVRAGERVVGMAQPGRHVQRIGVGVAAPRRVHAVEDDDARKRLAEDARGETARVEERRVFADARPHSGADARRHLVRLHVVVRRHVVRQARELHFPRVGQAVEVGVGRERVHAAAADAGRVVVGRLAVDEAQALESLAALVVRIADDDPAAAFLSVIDAVGVGVAVVRIGREELVVPALRLARMVLVDRLAALVGVARVGARELRRIGEDIVVNVGRQHELGRSLGDRIFLLAESRARVAVGVELPAVRHAVAVRVGAVHLDDALVRLAGLLEGLRDQLGELAVRRLDVVRAGRPDVVRARRLRVHRRHRGLRGDVAPVVAGLLDLLARIGDAEERAVAAEQVFVIRRVRDRVDRLARRALALLPARADEAILVPEPARSRIEPEDRTDLVVEHDERNGIIALHRTALVDLLARLEGAGHPPGLQRPLRVLREIVVPDHRILDRILRHVFLATIGRHRAVLPERSHHERANRLGLRHHVDTRFARGRTEVPVLNELPADVEVPVGLDLEDAPLDLDLLANGFSAEKAQRRERRHEVAVGVRRLVARALRVEAHHDLPRVAHVVAIRVPMAGIRADQVFLVVGKTVVVKVARRLLAARLARIEVSLDLGVGDGRAEDEAPRVKALEDIGLAVDGLGRTRRHGHVGEVPEVVFPAVGEVVAVSIVRRGIHADALAGRFRAPARQVRRPERIVVRRRIRRIIGRVVRDQPRLPRGELVLAEVGVGLEVVLRVEARLEAAQLADRRERMADRRIALLRRLDERHLALDPPDARQVVLVGVGLGEVLEVRHVADGIAVDELQEAHARAPPDLHHVDVGDAVPVHVAAVVGFAPLLREDRLDLGQLVAALLAALVVEREEMVLKRGRRQLRIRLHDHRLARLVHRDPRVEEAVPLVGVVEVLRRSRVRHVALGAKRRPVNAVDQLAVVLRMPVDRRGRIARRVDVRLLGALVVVPRLLELQHVILARAAQRVHMALTAAVGRHVLRLRRLRRTERRDPDRLRRHHPDPEPRRHPVAALVVARDHRDLGERIVRHGKVQQPEGPRVLRTAGDVRVALLQCHHLLAARVEDARPLDREEPVREVEHDVAHVPPERDLLARRPRVRHAEGDAALRRLQVEVARFGIVDADRGLALRVPVAPGIVEVVRERRRRHLRLNAEFRRVVDAAVDAVHVEMHLLADVDRLRLRLEDEVRLGLPEHQLARVAARLLDDLDRDLKRMVLVDALAAARLVLDRREATELHEHVRVVRLAVLVEPPRAPGRRLDDHVRRVLGRQRELADLVAGVAHVLVGIGRRLLVPVPRVDLDRLERVDRVNPELEGARAVRRHRAVGVFVRLRVVRVDVGASVQEDLRQGVRRVDEAEVGDLHREHHRIARRHDARVVALADAVHLDPVLDRVIVLPVAAADRRERRIDVHHAHRAERQLVVRARERGARLVLQAHREAEDRLVVVQRVAVEEAHRERRRLRQAAVDLHARRPHRRVDQVRAHLVHRHEVGRHRLVGLERIHRAVVLRLLQEEPHVQAVAFLEAAAVVDCGTGRVADEELRTNQRLQRLRRLRRHLELNLLLARPARRILHHHGHRAGTALRRLQHQREAQRLALDELHPVAADLLDVRARDLDRVPVGVREEVAPVVLRHGDVQRHRLAVRAHHRRRRLDLRDRPGFGHLQPQRLVHAREERLRLRADHLGREADLRRRHVLERAERRHVELHEAVGRGNRHLADAGIVRPRVLRREEHADDVRRQHVDARELDAVRERRVQLDLHVAAGPVVGLAQRRLELPHLPVVVRRHDRDWAREAAALVREVGKRHRRRLRLRLRLQADRAADRRVVEKLADDRVAPARRRAHVQLRRRARLGRAARQAKLRLRRARRDRHLQAALARRGRRVDLVRLARVLRIVRRHVEDRRVVGPHVHGRDLLTGLADDRDRRPVLVAHAALLQRNAAVHVAPRILLAVEVNALHADVRPRQREVRHRVLPVGIVGQVVSRAVVEVRERAHCRAHRDEIPPAGDAKVVRRRVHVRHQVVGIALARLVDDLRLDVEQHDRQPQVARLHRVTEVEVGVHRIADIQAARHAEFGDQVGHEVGLHDLAAHVDAQLRRLPAHPQIPVQRIPRHEVPRHVHRRVQHADADVGLVADPQVLRIVDAGVWYLLDADDVAVLVLVRPREQRRHQRGNRKCRDLDQIVDLHSVAPHFEIHFFVAARTFSSCARAAFSLSSSCFHCASPASAARTFSGSSVPMRSPVFSTYARFSSTSRSYAAVASIAAADGFAPVSLSVGIVPRGGSDSASAADGGTTGSSAFRQPGRNAAASPVMQSMKGTYKPILQTNFCNLIETKRHYSQSIMRYDIKIMLIKSSVVNKLSWRF